jgi:hypothetical protein
MKAFVNRNLPLLLIVLFVLGGAACGRASTPTAALPAATAVATSRPSPSPTTLPPTATNTSLPTATATPTLPPTATPTPTPAYPVHSGEPLPSLRPLEGQWEQAKLVADYASGKPSQLLRGSLSDVLAVYSDRVEVFRGAEANPRVVFQVSVDPLLQHFSVGENLLAVASEDKVEVYNPEGESVYSLSPAEGEAIRAVALSPDGEQVAYTIWKWGEQGVTSYICDKSGDVKASFPGTVVSFSASGNLLFIHEGAYLRAYNTQGYTLAYALPVGEGTVFYTIHPQGKREAFLDQVFGWSRYASAGWPTMYVDEGDKPRRTFRPERWGIRTFFDFFSLPTTWNPW